jgi:hypothetical protein
MIHAAFLPTADMARNRWRAISREASSNHSTAHIHGHSRNRDEQNVCQVGHDDVGEGRRDMISSSRACVQVCVEYFILRLLVVKL